MSTAGEVNCTPKVGHRNQRLEVQFYGKKLYDVLLAFVKENGYKTILLDAPHNTERAHKFYEKAGFREVKEDDLPIKFSHPYKDCDFFLLEL